MACRRMRYVTAGLTILGLILVAGPHAAFGQVGGFGGLGGGVGGGIGGGGLGNIPQGAGVIVDANGVLRLKMFRDPGGQLHRQRFQAAKAALDPKLSKLTPMRKVSLNRLETAIAERLQRGEGLTDEMKYLAGLLRIQYVFFYPESNDIVIAGPAEGFALDASGRVRGLQTGRSIVELQDLVAALRAYAPHSDPTNVIGCSIDPTKEGLTKMQQFLASLRGRVAPSDDVRIAQGLRENLGLQTVTVSGVSPKTHFAQVLVEADYRMKLVGIGLERPAVAIKSYVERARPGSVARNALQRWYFVPEYQCIKVSDDEMAMELVGWGVKLVGQDEAVRPDGVRIQSGSTDKASDAFCQEFTEKYPSLADREPVYAQLRNLIDMSVAAAYIQQKDFYGQSGWSLGVLGDEQKFPIETFETPRQVETAVNVVWKGNTLMTPIGGGVTIQPRKALESSMRIPDEGGKVESLRKETKVDKLAAGQWWWD